MRLSCLEITVRRRMAFNLSQSGTLASLQGCREKVVRGLRSENEDEGTLFNEPCHMESRVLEFEKRLISQALATANGRITHAAKWLDIGRQKLAYIIETRHPDLLKERTPVHRRPRKAIR